MEIKFNKVTYDKKQTKILKELNLIFKDNKITSIIGPNGSGKSTILKLLIKQIKPTSGEITCNPKITKKQIGVVSQKYDFAFSTVKEELIDVLITNKYKTKNQEKRIKDALILVGLSQENLNKNPNQLSKSEKTKLTIAKALIHNPNLIIMDEISLDNYNKQELIKLLRLMKLKYNKTIIILTKDTNFAHAISDYVYVINNGEVVTKGTKYKVFTNINLLKENKIKPPRVIELTHLIENKKNVKMEYRDDINDLMKDIYRCIR